MDNSRTIAYFSMEIALAPSVPTYSGGLGVLAGDTIRSAADAKVPMVAVSLIHRNGYFYQRLDSAGNQTEEAVQWAVDDFLQQMPQRASVEIEGRPVQLCAWKYEVAGSMGDIVPVYLLDTDLPENTAWDRTLTDVLYGGDAHYRLCQEVVLGIGGIRILRALGYDSLRRFHMNEGHASLLSLELLEERVRDTGRTSPDHEDVEHIRRQCAFTTHTPVPAGHDKFPMDLVTRVLGQRDAFTMKDVFCCEGLLNMTYLALNLSHYVNGVAKSHGRVSQQMFASYTIDSITNGVHAPTWVSPPFAQLFDRYIPGWREDNFSLRYALSIPPAEIWNAHRAAKRQLIDLVNRSTNTGMDLDVLTLGFARRITAYKRPGLLFHDPGRLAQLASQGGGLQVVYAGKAHPRDDAGKDIIRKIFQQRAQLRKDVRIAYLPNYDMELGRCITAGVDVWLNTPRPPLEASGTSGMKAALNGVPSLSVLDGWWVEGCIEGITGWYIGSKEQTGQQDDAEHAAALYQRLEQDVLPTFYEDRPRFLDIMRHTVALNGSFFNTGRMIQQYVVKAYLA